MPASNVTNQREQRRVELTRERDQFTSRAEAFRWLKERVAELDDGDAHHRAVLREVYLHASKRADEMTEEAQRVQQSIDAVTASISAAYAAKGPQS